MLIRTWYFPDTSIRIPNLLSQDRISITLCVAEAYMQRGFWKYTPVIWVIRLSSQLHIAMVSKLINDTHHATKQNKTSVYCAVCNLGSIHLHSFQFFRIFLFLEECFSNFPKFWIPVFQFLNFIICTLHKTIFWCLIFWERACITLSKDHNRNRLAAFPPKYLVFEYYFTDCNNSRIWNWKTAFLKFGKFENGVSKI